MLSDNDYNSFIDAGKIASKARELGVKLIKVDASIEEVTDEIESYILSQNAKMAFPAQISLNNVAAHNCACKNDPIRFKKGDVAKLDVGVHVNGFIGDTASTVDLGDNSKLIEASRDALNNVIKLLEPGITTGKIGLEIENTIRNKGFSPVSNLSGHGLGKYLIHTKPSVPNIGTGDNYKIMPGTMFAIEPFASSGSGYVTEGRDAEVFVLEQTRPIRSTISREVLVEIKKYNGLPFCSRWLANKFSTPKINFALREMLNLDMIRMYPPLSDKASSFVSQAEHSVLMEEDKAIITTK